MIKFLSYKFQSKSVITFLAMCAMCVTSSFALADSQKFLFINKDNVKTKVNIVNTSKKDSNVTLNVIGNNKKSIKEEINVAKVSKKEVSIDLLKNISKINSGNKKVESGILDIKSDSKDAFVNIKYLFKNDKGKINSTVNYNENEITNSKSYFVINKFIYENLKNVKLYFYNLDDSDFEGKIERYSSIGKLEGTQKIGKVKKGEEKVFDFGNALEDTFVVIPSRKQKYVSYIKLEYKNGKIDIIKPNSTFKKTTLLKSEGILTLFNTSKNYMLVGYEVYDKGKLEFEGEFAFIPKQQKFIDLGEQTSSLEFPIIRLVSSNLNNDDKFQNSQIVASINTKIKKKNIVNNFKNIKGEVGVKFTTFYDASVDKNSYLNVCNEEERDANITIKSKKGDLELDVKANDILQVPLSEIVENAKKNEVLNIESENANVSLSFDDLKNGNKKANISVLKSKSVKDLFVNQKVFSFDDSISTSNSNVNKKANFKGLVESDIKTLQDKNLGFNENQQEKIEQSVNDFLNDTSNGTQNNGGNETQDNKGNGTQNDNTDNNSIARCPDRKVNEEQCMGVSNDCGYKCPQNSTMSRIVCNLVGNNQITTVTRITCPCDSGFVDTGTSCEKCKDDEVIQDGKCVQCKGNGLFIRDGKCKKCKEGRYYNGEKCVVCEGYYNEGLNKCIPCSDFNMSWDYENNKCICIDGFERNERCIPCGNGKRTGDGKSCKCDDGYKFTNNLDIGCEKIECEGDDRFINGNECVVCHDGGKANKDSKTCVCPENNEQIDKTHCKSCQKDEFFSKGYCVKCDNGYSKNNKCIKCDHGYVNVNMDGCVCNPSYGWNSSKEICEKCEDNQIRENNTCKDCENGYIVGNRCIQCSNGILNESGYGCTCNPGYGWNNNNFSCEPCSQDEIQFKNKCIKCENGLVNNGVCLCNIGFGMNEYSGKCEECNARQITNNNKCENCPNGNIVINNECKSCKNGSFDENNNCKCNNGYGWDESTNSCVKCDSSEITQDNKCHSCGENEFIRNNKCISCSGGGHVEGGECVCPEGHYYFQQIGIYGRCVNSDLCGSYASPDCKLVKEDDDTTACEDVNASGCMMVCPCKCWTGYRFKKNSITACEKDLPCPDGLIWQNISNISERGNYAHDTQNGKCCKENEVACFTRNVFWNGYTYICCPEGTSSCSQRLEYIKSAGVNEIVTKCDDQEISRERPNTSVSPKDD